MKLFNILVILFGFKLVFAGEDITSGFEFLTTDFNPRTSATGNAFSTFRGDVGTIYINPAGLAYAENDHYVFNFTKLFLDINGGMAAYTQDFQDFGRVSYGVVYLNYGSFDYTDEFANKTGGTFSASDVAFSIGWAKKFEQNLSYGANLKYIFSQIDDYNASALAVDLGLIYQASQFLEDLYFAFSVQNIGKNIEYFDKIAHPLPLNIRAGISKKLEHLPLEVAFSFVELNRKANNISDFLKRFSVGGEFKVSESLRLRLGYDNLIHQDQDINDGETQFGGVSGGLGIYIKSFRFDYAYSNYNLLGNIHRIGIQGTL